MPLPNELQTWNGPERGRDAALSTREDLLVQMLEEARAMIAYALTAGRPVAGWIVETIARVDEGASPREDDGGEAGDAPDAPGQDASLRALTRAHVELAKIIAPATPDLVLMLEAESRVPRLYRVLGVCRAARSFMLIAILSLATFIGTTLSPYINNPELGNIFSSSGYPLFVNELFFASSAAVGASFGGLFKIDQDITSGAFSPKLQSSYWVQLILGIVAGLLLSTLLNINVITPTDEPALTRMNFSAAGLALLGGFSSSAVQRVLQRMIETLEAVVRGSGEQEVAARERAGKARLEHDLAAERVRLSATLTDIQRRMAMGESPEAVRRYLEQINRRGAESIEGLFEDGKGPSAPGSPMPSAQS